MLEQRERLLALAALVQDAGERDGGVGAAGLELERAPQDVLVAGRDERVGLGGHERVEEALDRAGGWAPVNSATTLPSLNALTAGIPWIPKAAAMPWLASVSSLASSTLPSRARDRLLEHGRQRAAGPAPLGPEVDDDGHLVRAVDDLAARSWPR